MEKRVDTVGNSEEEDETSSAGDSEEEDETSSAGDSEEEETDPRVQQEVGKIVSE